MSEFDYEALIEWLVLGQEELTADVAEQREEFGASVTRARLPAVFG